MAASSASTKGWLLPVVTATFGYALTKQQAPIALLGTAAVIVFAVLDANYLNQERAFRRLYDAVAAGKNVEPFSMNPSLAAPATGKPVEAGKWWREVWAAIRGWIPPATVWSSWAIAPFYGSFVLLGLLIVTFAL
jgi:histidine triad (HIT) family protein